MAKKKIRRKKRTTTVKKKKTATKNKDWLDLYDKLYDNERKNFPSEREYKKYIDKLYEIGAIDQSNILKSFNKLYG